MYGLIIISITIGQYVFKQANGVTITRSVDLLTDTATIRLPKSWLVDGYGKGFEPVTGDKLINRGDKVTITVGYQGIIEEVEFEGYVKDVKPTIPLEIECEDATYLLRRDNLQKVWKNIELRDLLKELVKGTDIVVSTEVPGLKLERFMAYNVSPAAVLQKIKDEYGLVIYIDDKGHLFAGLRRQLNVFDRVNYNFHKHRVKADLTYVKEENLRIRVKAIGIDKDNSRITIEVGDFDGEVKTFRFYNITNKTELKKVAENKLAELRYSGLRGTFTSFLYPKVDRGWEADLVDPSNPEINGIYFVPKVVTSLSNQGARRKVHLGVRLS
jgi:hypothetical protein